jgi:hypothetical protein
LPTNDYITKGRNIKRPNQSLLRIRGPCYVKHVELRTVVPRESTFHAKCLPTLCLPTLIFLLMIEKKLQVWSPCPYLLLLHCSLYYETQYCTHYDNKFSSVWNWIDCRIGETYNVFEQSPISKCLVVNGDNVTCCMVYIWYTYYAYIIHTSMWWSQRQRPFVVIRNCRMVVSMILSVSCT